MARRKRILVVCYSLTGNTARIAKALAKRLDADLEIIREIRSQDGWLGLPRATVDALRQISSAIETPKRDPSGYDVTVIGTPVWAGRMTPAVRAYLKHAQGRLRNAVFFITSGNTIPDKVTATMASVAHCQPTTSIGFNARELHDANACEKKLTALVEVIQRLPEVLPQPAADHAA